MKRKNGGKQRHVVAWINKAEWDQVLEYLYSKDCSLQRYALHRISAWKARYASSTPVAVDCTADLVRCQVLDRSSQLGAEDLVLLYGAALVRFVNLITERQQGKTARPLRRLAGNLNIPEWVVDLRHDVTHRKLPSLKWCRKGCQEVLEWLQQEYWARQLGGGLNDEWKALSDGEDPEEDLKRLEDEFIARQREIEVYKHIRELLISFEKDQFQALEGQPEDQDRSFHPAPFADMSWLLGEIKHVSLESSELLIDVLVEDGFLIPTIEQLQILGCNTFDDESPVAPRLPHMFLRFWLPLLKMLNSPAFIHLLLEKLFAELKILSNEPNSQRHFYVSAWISEVILCNTNKYENHCGTKFQKKARMKDRIFVNRLQLRWQQLMSACLDAPCVSTPHLLQLILDDMEHPLPLETRQRLIQLCSIYTRAEPSEDITPHLQKDQPVYTLDSLHEKLQNYSRYQEQARRWRADADGNEDQVRSDGLAEKAKLLRGSPWQVCTDKVLWKNFPLGKVPGQSDDPSCLMVDNHSTMTVFDQPVELEGNIWRTAPGGSALPRTVDGLLWTQTDVIKLKSGLQLF